MGYFKRLFAFAGMLFLSSCGAIRKANRIECLFLDHYLIDTKGGQRPKGYAVQTGYSSGTTTVSSSGHVHQGLGTYSVNVSLIDTLSGIPYLIDDAAGIFALVKNNKNCEQYYRKYLRQKRFQRMSRYGSIAAMGFGIALLSSSDPDNGSPTKSEIRKGNMGAYLLLGGFLNWIGGGIGRNVTRRTTIMKAAYVYQFGPLPKYLPPITRNAKRALLRSNPMFRK